MKVNSKYVISILLVITIVLPYSKGKIFMYFNINFIKKNSTLFKNFYFLYVPYIYLYKMYSNATNQTNKVR